MKLNKLKKNNMKQPCKSMFSMKINAQVLQPIKQIMKIELNVLQSINIMKYNEKKTITQLQPNQWKAIRTYLLRIQ